MFAPHAGVVDITPDGHLGAAGSLVLVGSLLALQLALIAIALNRRRVGANRARTAAASFDAQSPALTPGERICFGRVAHADGSNVAVRVEIEQEGTESESSGSWSYSWTETNRKVIVAPFDLVMPDGVAIRVLPNEDVFLVDELDGRILVNRTKRIRTAELVPDEKVYAFGALSKEAIPGAAPAGYRASGRGWVLRPPKSEAMLLSSEPLARRFLVRSRFHAFSARILAIVAVVVHALLIPFYARAFDGTTLSGPIVGLNNFWTEDGDGKVHHTQVRVALGKATYVDDVDEADFAALKLGQTAFVRSARHLDSQELGAHATLHGAWALLLLEPILMGLLYRAVSERTRPWYMRRLQDSGSGKLPAFDEEKAEAGPSSTGAHVAAEPELTGEGRKRRRAQD